ncbi:HEAT repeat domain-containing protein [Acidicapsa dinghuensis]|uniref:HEAT repeat domain-containing protein n=1 Tax=Acidicapsa dinghuensis TaxID=2218256 RepID=A0ABW1EAG7_9BACT|nr:HEAT repeat domain-containing protein [Acidicapsa dinghuensis]
MRLLRISSVRRVAVCGVLPLLAITFWASIAVAQDSASSSSAGSQGQDEKKETGSPRAADMSPAEMVQWSWRILTDNVQDTKHFENQTQALDALSSLGANAKANGLIAAAMKDTNLDVRTAAVLAAGKAKSRTLVEPVKELLDDAEPQVMYAAATTLWTQFKDRSGEDLLEDIAAGDRKANPTLVKGAKHDISRTLHSPSALTKLGVTTGAGLVLGPFGFSVTAIEYARKNGSDSARVKSIELLAEDRTADVRDQMLSALDDKDPGVRAAALRVVGSYHRAQDGKRIEPLFDDAKLPVRLAAAAAYINCAGGVVRAKSDRP